MTASTSPRLQLMLPTGSDDFTTDDFVNTMTTLDGRPGVLPVANYGALPTGLTSANHGSCFVQLDNGAMWMWNRPGAPAGYYQRVNNNGQLVYATQPSAVSTSTTDESAGATMVNVNFTALGGRNLMAIFSHANVQNSGTFGYSRVTMWLDGNTVERSHMSGGAPNKGISHRLIQGIGKLGQGTTHNIKVTLSSLANWGGGTSSASAIGQLYVWEM